MTSRKPRRKAEGVKPIKAWALRFRDIGKLATLARERLPNLFGTRREAARERYDWDFERGPNFADIVRVTITIDEK
jgi:hypothetical protein